MPNTILLVEDDDNDRLLIRKALEPFLSQWEVRTVKDGAEAIAYLEGKGPGFDRRANPLPALVLLDLHLPGMDGVEVLEWIRAHPRHRGLVVVVITGANSPQRLERIYDLHANSLIDKSRVLSRPSAAREVFGYWLGGRHNLLAGITVPPEI